MPFWIDPILRELASKIAVGVTASIQKSANFNLISDDLLPTSLVKPLYLFPPQLATYINGINIGLCDDK
jgi:hypothetical protein